MEQTSSILGGNMKRSKYESIINAAGRHLLKRNCTVSDPLCFLIKFDGWLILCFST